MTRRPLVLLLALGMGAGACRLLVGDDDHHLRDDDDGGDASSAGDGSVDVDLDASARDASARDGSGEAGPYVVTVLASGRMWPSTVVAKGGSTPYVFWVEESVNDAGAIMRVPDLGTLAAAETLAFAANPRGMRLDLSVGLAFSDDTRPVARLRHVGLTPGSPVTVLDEDFAGRSFGVMAAISPYAFTEAREPNDGGVHVRRSSLDDGGGPTCFTYTSPGPDSVPSLAFDGTNVYIADTVSGAVLRAPNGCAGSAVVFAADQHAVVVGLDGAHVYWLTADGHVRNQDKAEVVGIHTYDVTLVAPGGLDHKNGIVYVTDEGAGIVYELPPTGAPVVVATGQGGPHGIAVTSSGVVYWTNRTTGEIVRASR